MFNSLKVMVQENKGTIVKRGLAVVGTVAGFAIVNKLIKAGAPCEDCEVEYDDDEEDDDSEYEDTDNEEEA